MQNMEEIYNQYAKVVYKYVFCLTHSKHLSEDITQETFYKAITEVDKFKGNCKISVWLCQIAKNIWYDELRKRKKDITSVDGNIEIVKDETSAEDTLIEKEERLYIFKQIQKLDDSTKEVMYLRLNGNLNFKDIGEILNKSENWARVIFYRGKEKIKDGDLYETN